jgi:hypothetical protein
MEHAPRMTSPSSSCYFQHLGGAISRPGPDTTAFGHREAAFDFTILTVWDEPSEKTASGRPTRRRPTSGSSRSRTPTTRTTSST